MADDKFTQEDIDKAVKAATDKIQESIDKLESKNEELVGELRTAKVAARKAGDIKPEDLTAAEERAEKAEAKVSDLEKSVKALTGERDKAVKALDTESGFTAKLLIQDGLKSALIANGVKDEDYIDTLTAKFAIGAKVVTEGEERRAMHGDKPLPDFIKEWAASDAGKKFVAAAMNSGGGAGGGDQKSATAQTMTRTAFNALPQNEQAALQPQMVKGELSIVDDAA